MPVYVLTGANRGLGLEFVRQISQASSNTIIAGVRSISGENDDLKALTSKNKSIHILECDVSNIPSINSLATSIASALAGQKIDFLLNNGGINARPEQSSLTLAPTDLDTHMAINVLGPAKLVEALYSADLFSPNVRILNMTSGLGSMVVSSSIKPRKCATYSISKAALNMLTVHQSGDLEGELPGVVVICMDPGWVQTRMGGEGAQITPEVSIGGMLKVLHGLGKESNGKFFTYDGSEVPW